MTYHVSRRAILALFVTLLVPAVAAGQRSASTIPTEKIFEAIGVREGLTVCEIGAGSGELSIEAARIAGPNGRVYTSELGDARVKTLQERVAASGLAQITVVAGDPVKTNFPDGACDALFMRNVYHHFSDPAAMNASIHAAMKPGGRVAIVDFTPPEKEATVPGDRSKDGMHGVSAESVGRELKEAGFELVGSESGERRWFMVVGSKPGRDQESRE
jgi:tRNA A58 N-methylase Trm61